MLSANANDLQFLFESAGQPVLINDTERTAIITNPQMSANEERYIHTLDGVSQGDIVLFDDKKFIAIGESVTKRHGKFKTKIRHCNFIIELAGETIQELLKDDDGNIILDDYGEPILVEVDGEPYYIPAIVDSDSLQVFDGQIQVEVNRIIVTVQDNDIDRKKFDTNKTFHLMGQNWKVKNVDIAKKGLLILVCEKVI